MSSVSGIGSNDSSVYNDGVSSSDTTGTSAPTVYSRIRDTVKLQSDSSLVKTLLPQSSTSNTGLMTGYPTNIMQAAQSQAILTNNPDLAQLLSQQSSSPLVEPLTAPLEALQSTGSNTGIDSSETNSLVSSMATLREVQSAGALKSNPTLAQSFLKSYFPELNIPSSGSQVDTTA